jgi:XrtJ-associated TM-motif-TM protein
VNHRPAVTNSCRALSFSGPGRITNTNEYEDIITVKKTALAFAFTLILATALPLRAQTGCDDSPEDPTIVLALVGGAGALAARVWRSRYRKG